MAVKTIHRLIVSPTVEATTGFEPVHRGDQPHRSATEHTPLQTPQASQTEGEVSMQHARPYHTPIVKRLYETLSLLLRRYLNNNEMRTSVPYYNTFRTMNTQKYYNLEHVLCIAGQKKDDGNEYLFIDANHEQTF